MPSQETLQTAAHSKQAAAGLHPPVHTRVEEGFLVQQVPPALPPPPRSGLLPALRRILPVAALFGGGLLVGWVLGPTGSKQ
jgi:hypothetical protein